MEEMLQNANDIASIKQNMQKLLDREKLIMAIAECYATNDSTDMFIKNTLELVSRFMNMSSIVLAKYNFKENELELKRACGDERTQIITNFGGKMSFRENTPIYDELIKNNYMPLVYNDTSEDIPFEYRRKIGIKAFMIIPLFVSNEFWGVLEFNQCEYTYIWSEDDISMGRHVGNVLSGTLTRQHAEERLYRLEALFNSTQQAVTYVDKDGSFDFFNPATCELSGYSYEEIKEGGAMMFYDDDAKRRLMDEVVPAILKDGKYEFEIPATRKNGEKRIIRYSAFVIGDDKRGHGYIGTDVTEQKRLETQLERMSALINSSPQYIAYINNEGEFDFINPATLEITGFTYDEIIRGGIQLFYDEQTNQRIREDIIPAVLEKGKYYFEIPLIRKDGEERIMSFSAFSIGSDKKGIGSIATDITEQKRLEQELIDAKEKAEYILNTAPISYIMSVHDKIIEINEKAKKNLGLDVTDDIRQAYTNLEDRDMLIMRLEKEKLITNEIIRYNMTSGKSHRCLVNITTVEYGEDQALFLWMVDIEQNETKKDQLRLAQQSLQTIIDFIPIPIRITDKKNNMIIYVNKSCLTLFGYDSPDDMCNKTVSMFLPEMQKDGMSSEKKTESLRMLTETVTMEIEYLAAGDRIIEAKLIASPIDYQGVKSTLGIIQDLTAEKEIRRMLQSTAEKEKEANLLKSRFLVNMSHEIRTPMNAIIGFTEIELHKRPDKDTAEIYKKINISAKNLLDIINDILDLSKIEADKIELFDSEFELSEVVSSAMLVASPRLDGKNVEMIYNSSLDLPRFIIGDRTRLWQILKNLLDNAAKFTENGKIVLAAYIDDSRSDMETVYITFVISDTGIGISDDQMYKLFLPYRQVYSEAQRKYMGTGLGMVISKQLCELMGGGLEAKSVMGEGTDITIHIPFKRSKNNDTELHIVQAYSLRGKRILAVDDDELSLEIISTLLKAGEADYELACSGEEAIKTIFARRDEGLFYDIILLDYMMAGLNGLETARQIHMSLSKAPKLLMVTAYQRQLLNDDLKRNGIDAIMEKPFVPSQFVKKILVTLDEDQDIAEQGEVFSLFKDANILLCEDNPLNQEVAAGMLEQFGITPIIADDGEHGIKILAEYYNNGRSFDLILMDLQMPIMDGYEATHVIRADPRFMNIPIISLTADAMKEIVDKCLEMGMNDHIAKPIDFASLHSILLKWLPESKLSYEQTKMISSNPRDIALERFGGDMDRFENMLRSFVTHLPDEWPSFEDAIQNTEVTLREIHKLKGAASNLSLMDFYRFSVQFESSMRENNPDKEIYDRLVSEGLLLKGRILRQTPYYDVQPEDEGTIDELLLHINNLKDALQNWDPVISSEIVKNMREKTWQATDPDQLRRLYESTRQYEFDEALDILDEVLKGVRRDK